MSHLDAGGLVEFDQPQGDVSGGVGDLVPQASLQPRRLVVVDVNIFVRQVFLVYGGKYTKTIVVGFLLFFWMVCFVCFFNGAIYEENCILGIQK